MKTETAEEEVVKVTFVPKVIQGGKGPPDPSGPDWLSNLEVNTTVWIQSKRDTNFPLGQLTVVYKGKKGIVVAVDEKVLPVDPVRFCNQYRLYETVQTAEEAKTETKADKEITDDCMSQGYHPSEPSSFGKEE